MMFRNNPILGAVLLVQSAVASDLLITGIIDGPLTGGLPKAVELYAINAISDLSVYGIGSANNGGGTDGQEFTFPSVQVAAGSYITVASESPQFQAYLGAPPDYISGAMSINGDDAIELFFAGAVADTFGDPSVDGTGQAWEYMDGWAYRNAGSSPSGGSFNSLQWTLSGPNALDGCTANNGCGSVFPFKSYGGQSPPTPTPPTPTPPGSITKIHAIQGSAPTVSITSVVTIEAIVTSLFYSTPDDSGPTGFFVQEEDLDADADQNTSEGIYVYCGTGGQIAKCASVAVGDQVQVSGTPSEFSGMSQIDGSSGFVSIISSGVSLPTPVDLTLPATGGTKDPVTFESVEGMLVRFPSTLVVSEYYNLARFGEIVLTEASRPYQFTHNNTPDTNGYSSFLANLAKRRIILDDATNFQNPATAGSVDRPYPYPTQGGFPNGGLSLTNKMRGGDTITGLIGVMHWSWSGAANTDAWRLRPVQGIEYSFASVNPPPLTTNSVGGTFKCASFNVLNYFTTLNQRGANTIEELQRQKDKIVSAMQGLDADVLGLIEIENSSNDQATADLVAGLNSAMGAGTYNYLATGSIGGDAIKVAFIYKPSTVNLVGNYAILDSSVDDRFIDNKNRPVLVQTFEQIGTGEKLTIAVNHFKSKGSSCSDVGDPGLNDGQANCPQTRANAALALADFLASDPTGSGDPDFLIIGDLNAYKNEDAIRNLITAGYTDLAEQFEGPNAYSYVFDGQLGYLDYALASGSLLTQVTGVTEWHINADELPLFDYNDCSQDGTEATFHRESCANGDLYASNPLRSSDHDPVLIGMNLGGGTSSPTVGPSMSPTKTPTSTPSRTPTLTPSSTPTLTPTSTPTSMPTSAPTSLPSNSPVGGTSSPTTTPTSVPTSTPTSTPSSTPTSTPTGTPTSNPTTGPTASPSMPPSATPTTSPIGPSNPPTLSPTRSPSVAPTKNPTTSPTNNPTSQPTTSPSHLPTASPASCSSQVSCGGEVCCLDTNTCDESTERVCVGQGKNKECNLVTTSTCVESGGGGGDCSTATCNYSGKDPCNADLCCRWNNKDKICGFISARRFLRH